MNGNHPVAAVFGGLGGIPEFLDGFQNNFFRHFRDVHPEAVGCGKSAVDFIAQPQPAVISVGAAMLKFNVGNGTMPR